MKRIILLELCVLFLATVFKGDSPPAGWYIQQIPVNKNIVDIYITDTLNGWAVSNWTNSVDTTFIFKTTNGGTTWVNQQEPSRIQLNDVKYVSPTVNYCVGDYGYISNIGGIVGTEVNHNEIPGKFSLEQNYTNPFNPSTSIKFSVPGDGNVKIVVYDIAGKEIATLINADMKTGKYKVEFDGTGLSSGVYFYKLISADYVEVKKMVFLK